MSSELDHDLRASRYYIAKASRLCWKCSVACGATYPVL